MLDFLIPKEKIQTYSLRQVPLENFSIIGVGQINPYCDMKYDNELFLTLVNFSGDSKKYDEKEGLVLADYFALRKCPRCHKVKLIPTKIYLNNRSDLVYAYCNSCSTCFEAQIKPKDLWVKQAKKIREKHLITGSFDEFRLE